MKKEIWKDIEGFEGLYQVSNLGIVRSLKFNKEKLLKPLIHNQGYLLVGLCKNEKQKKYRVHRLVAQAFLENPHNLPIINHKDENPKNNEVSNLEWCTYQYNNTYGTVNLKRAEKLSKIVFQYSKDGTFIREWESTMECQRNGFNSGAISNCCNGKRNYHKCFIWSYEKIY